MIKLIEPELLIKCRKEDKQMIASLLEDCEREYIQIMKNEVNQDDEEEEDKREFKTKLTVIETEFLNSG